MGAGFHSQTLREAGEERKEVLRAYTRPVKTATTRAMGPRLCTFTLGFGGIAPRPVLALQSLTWVSLLQDGEL